MKKSLWEAARDSFEIESSALANALSSIEQKSFEKAVKLLAGAERIGASGCGHSGIACMHFAHLMCCIELSARFISPAEAVHGASGFLKEGDVIVLASRGGQTSELLPIMEICKDKKVHIIAITENMESSLAKESQVVLKMRVDRETDKFDSQGTTSFVVLSGIFDALQAALIEETDFQNEQFAKIHPAGAVGKKLNP